MLADTTRDGSACNRIHHRRAADRRAIDEANSIGLTGVLIEREEDVGPAWEQALAAERPVLLEFRTDPDVPPLPPHISLEQAKQFASTLLQGDPDQRGILAQTAKQLFGALLPGKRKDN